MESVSIERRSQGVHFPKGLSEEVRLEVGWWGWQFQAQRASKEQQQKSGPADSHMKLSGGKRLFMMPEKVISVTGPSTKESKWKPSSPDWMLAIVSVRRKGDSLLPFEKEQFPCSYPGKKVK